MTWFTSYRTPPHATVVLSKNSLACGWLEQSKHSKQIKLHAYEKTSLSSHIGADGFFNPTAIGSVITNFLKTYSIKNATISCAFASPLVTEKLVTRSHATPDPNTLIIAPTQHTLWDYHYLYPTDTNEYVFYVCAVTQPLLLQYKLMAINHKLSLLTTTSQSAALLQLYRYINDNAFRASKLGADMQRCHNNPENLFTLDTLNRVITIPSHLNILPAHEKSFLLTMCGLIIAERD